MNVLEIGTRDFGEAVRATQFNPQHNMNILHLPFSDAMVALIVQKKNQIWLRYSVTLFGVDGLILQSLSKIPFAFGTNCRT